MDVDISSPRYNDDNDAVSFCLLVIATGRPANEAKLWHRQPQGTTGTVNNEWKLGGFAEIAHVYRCLFFCLICVHMLLT